MDRPLPTRSADVVEYRPPARLEPHRRDLTTVFTRPTVVVYVIPGNSFAENAAIDAIQWARTAGNIGVVIAVRAMNQQELQAALDWIARREVAVPVIIDSGLDFALGLKALRVPSFAVIDKGAVLKIRGLRALDAMTVGGVVLKDALRAAAAGKELPTSDGERVDNTTSLIGLQTPSADLAPAAVGSAKSRLSLVGASIKRPTLVVFWMATCPHCQKEMPKIAAWWRKNKAAVDLVTITRTDSDQIRQRTSEFLTSQQLLDLPVYSSDPQIYAHFKVDGIPTWLMIAPGGTIVAANIGEDESLYAHLDGALRKARP
jgi:thiol-disulfide isomerase/thioredoxin